MTTRLDKLKTALHEWETEVSTPIKANKGGDTWQEVQKIAAAVPAALTSPIHSIEQYQKSVDKTHDLPKIPTQINNLTHQFAAIKLTSVTKYQAAHGPGGAKQRGLLSTASAKAEEAKRVGLCDKLIQHHSAIKHIIDTIKTPEDLSKTN